MTVERGAALAGQAAVVDALSALIRAELDSDDRSRFGRIGRLATIAQQLLLEGAKRAEDFAPLERTSPKATRVTITGLSDLERSAMSALISRARTGTLLGQPWASRQALDAIDLSSLKEQRLELGADIGAVHKVLSKRLKPGRRQVSMVRYSSGRIEEIYEGAEPQRAEAAKAVTVAAPVLGCPAPDLDAAELRATEVLEQFLHPEQLKDLRSRQQLVAFGADTGHRYMLTSRYARDALRLTGGRSLFDLDERLPLCVHDWDVPPAEELLGLLVHLSLPGHETYVRSIPDRQGILSGA